MIEDILFHLAENVSLTRLSEIAGYHSRYLSRIFRVHTGTSISKFTGSRKMEYIRQLMTESNLNIREISDIQDFVQEPVLTVSCGSTWECLQRITDRS